MEINSRYCEVSTYAASSSGYNSSTASSSLNYIDDVVDNLTVIDTNHNKNNKKPGEIVDPKDFEIVNTDNNCESQTVTKLIITITLLKTEEVIHFIT